MLFCEVIGCRQPAAWVRSNAGGEPLEDYLCERCYHHLRGRVPDHAHYYVALTVVPAEAQETGQAPVEPAEQARQ